MKIKTTLSSHFVTPVIQGTMNGEDMNTLFEELRTELLRMSLQETSTDRSNSTRVDSWHSKGFLPKKGHPFNTFAKCTDSLARNAFKQIGLSGEPVLSGMWSIITPFGGNNFPHTHPETHLAGVVYMQCPSHCGDLYLVDPRPGVSTLGMTYSKMCDHHFYSDYPAHIKVREKGFVLFPGYLQHYTETNLSQDTDTRRIVIAFNYRQKRND